MSIRSRRRASCWARASIFFLAFLRVISRDSRPNEVGNGPRPEPPLPAKDPPPLESEETKVPIAELPPWAFSSNYEKINSQQNNFQFIESVDVKSNNYFNNSGLVWNFWVGFNDILKHL